MHVGPPATRTDEYLAAILEQLRVIAGLLEGGGQDQEPTASIVVDDADPFQGLRTSEKPTKRTRQRAARSN